MTIAHLLTFSTYASHVPGDPRGWTDRRDGYREPNEHLRARSLASARGAAVAFDETECAIVLRTFNEVCSHRGWTLHAAHVRREHVHIVVSALTSPEAMMRDFKSYSSRRLHEQGRFVGQAVWARRGDVRGLRRRRS